MEPVSTLQIEANVKNLSKIRTFLQDSTATLGLHQETIDDLILAVDEAATNIILHGYQGEPGLIDIVLSKGPESISLYLQDQAPSYDPTQVPPPDLSLPLESRPLGRLGIHLMRNLVDQVIYEIPPGGGNRLTLVKTIDNEGQTGGNNDH